MQTAILANAADEDNQLEPDYMQSVRDSFQVYDSFTQNLQQLQHQLDGPLPPQQLPYPSPSPNTPTNSIRPPFYGGMMHPQPSTAPPPTTTTTRGMMMKQQQPQHGYNGMPPPPAPGQNGMSKGYHPQQRSTNPVQQHHSSYPGYMIAALPSSSSPSRAMGGRVVVKHEVPSNGPYQPVRAIVVVVVDRFIY